MRTIALQLLVLALSGCGGATFPPAVIPPRPAADDFPDAGAVVLDDVATLDVRAATLADGVTPTVTATLDHRRRYKILGEGGLGVATVELTADAFSQVSGIRARAVSPGGRVTEMSAGAVVATPEVVGGKSIDVTALRFTVPGAEVGGLVEYRYQKTFADAAFVPTWLLGGRYPVMRAELSVAHGEDTKVDYRFGRGAAIEEKLPLRRTGDDGRDRLVFVVNDLPAYFPEPLAPDLARYAPWIAVVVTSAHRGQSARRLERWEDVARFVNTLELPVFAAAAPEGPRAVFAAARERLRVSTARGLAGLRPVSAARVNAGEPISNRDAAASLLSSLARGETEVALALVASHAGAPVSRDLPGLYGFVRAVVAIRARALAHDRAGCSRAGAAEADPVCRARDGDLLFLDASCARCRFGELPPELAGGEAVVLWPTKTAEWMTLPIDPPEQHRQSTHVQATLSVNGALEGKVEGRAVGHAATALLAAGRDALPATLFGEATRSSLSAVELEPPATPEKDLVYRGKLAGRAEKAAYQRYFVRPRDLVGQSFVGDWRETRRVDAVLGPPRLDERVATLELGVGYDVEMPAPARVSRPFADYTAGWERRERVLTYVRRVRLKTPVLVAADWDDFKRFVDQALAEDDRPIRVSVRD